MHEVILCVYQHGRTCFYKGPKLVVRGLQQDLIVGESVKHPGDFGQGSRLYPWDNDQERHYQTSIEFIGEPTDLFYLLTDEIHWTTFDAASEYDLWHRLMGHMPFKNIEQTIPHLVGLEHLIGNRYQEDCKCPSCMLGKSTTNSKSQHLDS